MTTVSNVPLLGGDAGTRQTIAAMCDMVQRSVATPLVRSAVTSIVGDVGGRDDIGQILAVRDWMCGRVRFLRDPANNELLHTPEWMLRRVMRDGVVHVDCDDAAILGAALCGAIGMNVAFVTAAFYASDAPFSHVWASAKSPDGRGDWIELDTTRPMQNLPVGAMSRCEVTQVL